MSIQERKREEKEERRRTIVDAAEIVLGEKSLEDMTMSDIADQARLSRSLLYVYFEDMDDIYLAVTLRGFRLLRNRFETAGARYEVGLWQVRAIGEAYVRFARENPVYFEAMARFEARTASPTGQGNTREAECALEAMRLMKCMTSAIQHGIDDGSIRPELDPQRAALVLWGYTHGLIQLGANKGRMLDRFLGVSASSLVNYGLNLAGDALYRGFGNEPGDASSPPREEDVSEQGSTGDGASSDAELDTGAASGTTDVTGGDSSRAPNGSSG